MNSVDFYTIEKFPIVLQNKLFNSLFPLSTVSFYVIAFFLLKLDGAAFFSLEYSIILILIIWILVYMALIMVNELSIRNRKELKKQVYVAVFIGLCLQSN
jgi:hypothetical protein